MGNYACKLIFLTIVCEFPRFNFLNWMVSDLHLLPELLILSLNSCTYPSLIIFLICFLGCRVSPLITSRTRFSRSLPFQWSDVFDSAGKRLHKMHVFSSIPSPFSFSLSLSLSVPPSPILTSGRLKVNFLEFFFKLVFCFACFDLLPNKSLVRPLVRIVLFFVERWKPSNSCEVSLLFS